MSCGSGSDGERGLPPAVTRTRLESELARFGITRVAFLGGLDRIGIEVAAAIRPLSRSVAVSLGKGVDRDAAFVSAVMEALETWHAERILRPVQVARLGDLTAAEIPLVDLAALAASGLGRVPPQLRLPWIEAEDLAGGPPRLVPLALVHTDWTLPLPPEARWFRASTSGLGAGHRPAEATLHALCELLERDASCRFYHLPPERRRELRLDLTSIADPVAGNLLDRLKRAGIEIALWRTPAVVPIASFLCLLRDREDPRGHAAIGAGCHPSARMALVQALLEAAQVRLTAIAGARDDLEPATFSDQARADRARIQALLFADPPGLSLAAVPDIGRGDPAADLAALVAALLNAGFRQVLRVDLSRPEVGIPVVRMVVPGLLPDPHMPGGPRFPRPHSG